MFRSVASSAAKTHQKQTEHGGSALRSDRTLRSPLACPTCSPSAMRLTKIASRLRLISWWDQERLAAAKILVIGAGGARQRDHEEPRPAWRRQRRARRPRSYRELQSLAFRPFPRRRLRAIQGRRSRRAGPRDLPGYESPAADREYRPRPGAGVYRWADVILGGLDNREARVAINRSAARAGKSGSTARSSGCRASPAFSIRPSVPATNAR